MIQEDLITNRYKDNYTNGGKNVPQKRSALDKLIEGNKKFTKKVENCILCGSNKFHLISEIDYENLPNKVCICESCGLGTSSDIYNEAFWVEYYSKFKVSFPKDLENHVELFARRTADTSFANFRYNLIKNKLGPEQYLKIKNVCEIGCADGANLYFFKKDGKNIFGSDLDKEKLEVGINNGLNLAFGLVEEQLEQYKNADLIILSHLIEHLENPLQFISLLRENTGPNVIIYAEIPGLFGVCNKGVSVDGPYCSTTDFLATLQFEHRFYYDKVSFNNLMKKSEFIDIYSDDWVRGLYKKNKSETKLQIEEKRGLQVIKRLKKIESSHFNPLNRIINATLRRIKH